MRGLKYCRDSRQRSETGVLQPFRTILNAWRRIEENEQLTQPTSVGLSVGRPRDSSPGHIRGWRVPWPVNHRCSLVRWYIRKGWENTHFFWVLFGNKKSPCYYFFMGKRKAGKHLKDKIRKDSNDKVSMTRLETEQLHTFYRNIFYKNNEAEICVILRIF